MGKEGKSSRTPAQTYSPPGDRDVELSGLDHDGIPLYSPLGLRW